MHTSLNNLLKPVKPLLNYFFVYNLWLYGLACELLQLFELVNEIQLFSACLLLNPEYLFIRVWWCKQVIYWCCSPFTSRSGQQLTGTTNTTSVIIIYTFQGVELDLLMKVLRIGILRMRLEISRLRLVMKWHFCFNQSQFLPWVTWCRSWMG